MKLAQLPLVLTQQYPEKDNDSASAEQVSKVRSAQFTLVLAKYNDSAFIKKCSANSQIDSKDFDQLLRSPQAWKALKIQQCSAHKIRSNNTYWAKTF